MTKRAIRFHLRITQEQLKYVWDWPAFVLTIPQVVQLHKLVDTRYTLPEVAKMLMIDAYKSGTPMFKESLSKCIAILSTTEGQKEWDEFMARKRTGSHPGKAAIKKKNEKIQQSFKVFKRVSDPLATDEAIEEFTIEHERKKEEASIVKPVVEPGSKDSHSPEVSI